MGRGDGGTEETGCRAVDSGVDRQSTPEGEGVFILSTPLDSDTVAGTTVTLAAGQVPVAGTTVSQPTEILIANGAPAATLAIVENVGSKTERVPAGQAHDVVTADGVVVEFPATALAAADTLRLERVVPTTAPAPLPGVAVRPLVALTLASGRTTFSSPVTLSLPYPDADQDGLVDETSPALPELVLTAWVFDAASQRWVRLPEARVLTAFNALRVATTQTGLYGVFRAADGSTGLAGTSATRLPWPPVRHRAGQWLAGHRCGDHLSVPGAREYHDAAEWHLRGAGRLCHQSRGTARGGRECPHDIDGAPDEWWGVGVGGVASGPGVGGHGRPPWTQWAISACPSWCCWSWASGSGGGRAEPGAGARRGSPRDRDTSIDLTQRRDAWLTRRADVRVRCGPSGSHF